MYVFLPNSGIMSNSGNWEKRQSQTRMCCQCDGFWEQQDEICFTLEICMVFLKPTLNKPCITPLLQSAFFICAVRWVNDKQGYFVPPVPKSSKLSHSCRFYMPYWVCTACTVCATFPTHHIPNELIILVTFSREYKFEACHHIILSTLLGTNLLLSSKFSSHKFSHPHTAMGSIMVLNIVIFMFLGSSETTICGSLLPWHGVCW
jgi:hypothetical protein